MPLFPTFLEVRRPPRLSLWSRGWLTATVSCLGEVLAWFRPGRNALAVKALASLAASHQLWQASAQAPPRSRPLLVPIGLPDTPEFSHWPIDVLYFVAVDGGPTLGRRSQSWMTPAVWKAISNPRRLSLDVLEPQLQESRRPSLRVSPHPHSRSEGFYKFCGGLSFTERVYLNQDHLHGQATSAVAQKGSSGLF
jgi:hypothetical protein